MELLLNLIWLGISCSALVWWVLWRRDSSSTEMPPMLRGLIVVVCILALLFPAISISDDLSQIPSLAEGNRIQDVLKSPHLRGIYHLAAIIPAILLNLRPVTRVVTHRLDKVLVSSICNLLWAPTIESRPPPQYA